MRKILMLVVVFFMAGCSFRPEIPSVDTTFGYDFEKSSEINDKWWQEFNDDRLNILVEEALKNNIDLKIAYINLQKSALSLKNSRADLLPSLSLNATSTRSANYQNTAKDQNPSNSFSLTAGLNYEIDLWGRVRDSIASNDALLKASEYDLNASRLSVASSVANGYFALVSLKMQEAVYLDTLKSYRETMKYREKQLNAGAITQAVYLQSVAAVQSAEISLNNVRNSMLLASNTLAILCNKSNDEILNSLVDTAATFPKAPNIDAQIGSDILLKRSDVAKTYENLKSSNALVGVARSAYFPTLSLTGLFGFSSNELETLFDVNMWSLAGNLTQTLFDFGKTANKVEIAKLVQSASALTYENTIKTALSEIRIALNNRKTAVNVFKQTKELLDSQTKIYDLINSQYEAGYVDHLNLLDAQRNLLNTRLSDINANLNLNNAVVDVYKAFGGGFRAKKD